MLRRILLIVAFTTALIIWPLPTEAADYFGRPDNPPTATPLPTITHRLPFVLPSPLRRALGALVSVQSRLNAEIRSQLRLVREGQSYRPAAAIVVVSFLYGVFHAAGPGHGKMVVGSYFLTHRSRISHGLAMSATAAFIQAMSAIILVGGLDLIFEMSARRILDQAATLEMISYGFIVALGLWMAWGVIRNRSCCAHAPHDHERDHGHSHARQDHHHSEEPEHGRRHILTTAAAVGLRPCSGAILVLVFTLANGIFAIGVLSTFAMAVGVAVTVTMVSVASLGLHRFMARLGRANQRFAQRIGKAASLGGALVIAAFGLLQLLGIWSGLIVPMAG
jgi:ABC-type nickel/cobalt efflux system permease component RcnA